MSLDTFYSIIGLISLFALVAHGRAKYWKGKFESLDNERPNNGGGWREEALFLRRLVDKEAAEAALNDCEEH